MSTLSTYLRISKDPAIYQKVAASEPMVKAQTKYYQDNIAKIKTVDEFVNNYRIFSYAMTAFGLGDQVYAKAMIKKVLDQGLTDSKNLAFSLNNPKILALAKTFNFAANGASTTTSDAVQKDVVSKYIQQQMETDQGQMEPGAQLALYFQRTAPTIKSVYNILADKSLLTVVQTALGISQYMSMMDIDRQAEMLKNVVKFDDFTDPPKLQKFLQRFAAIYDVNNAGSQSSLASNLVVSTYSTKTVGFSASLLSAIQGLKVGGF
jgi:hypothetical protein